MIDVVVLACRDVRDAQEKDDAFDRPAAAPASFLAAVATFQIVPSGAWTTPE